MLRYIYGDELQRYPKLRDTMFRDRADQFARRLNWEVQVGENGWEQDKYDQMNPLYVIWQKRDGCHGGSMRFMPTIGNTMINDHFIHLTQGVHVRHPLIWECTRFCLSDGSDARTSTVLLLGGLEVGLGFHLTDAVGVFDARIIRIYRRLGWSPSLLGSEGTGRAAISVGLWAYRPEQRLQMLRRAGVSSDLSHFWFDRAFGSDVAVPLTLVG